jgi:hypothetical protein
MAKGQRANQQPQFKIGISPTLKAVYNTELYQHASDRSGFDIQREHNDFGVCFATVVHRNLWHYIQRPGKSHYWNLLQLIRSHLKEKNINSKNKDILEEHLKQQQYRALANNFRSCLLLYNL